MTKQQYTNQAIVSAVPDVFQVLADPTRRALIHTLRHGERAVGELVDEVDIDQPGVSKQLRILHDAGFVRVRRDRTRRLYSLRPEPFKEVADWVREFEQVWGARF